ncbi:hypothetical protein ACFL2T_05200 [Elusimicrobiota bacterium]
MSVTAPLPLRILFWAVLVLVVAGLLIVIRRLLPPQPPPGKSKTEGDG